MRVFVSSTIFDLIDVRAEIASQLRLLGIVPVMSDDKLSDFHLQPHQDSIETCLVNLASCDEVIVILDRRYGPKLGKAGFDDVSATHLEYQRAKQLKKPIHVFVRDRTEADHGIWRKNKSHEAVKLNWVGEKDHGIFKLLDDHKSLQANSGKSNWVDTFSSSIDLKAAIDKRFQARILPQRLLEALQRNEFPLIDVKAEAHFEQHGMGSGIYVSATLTNNGGSPAFNFQLYWEESKTKTHDPEILAPGGEQTMNFFCAPPGAERILIVEYEGAIGVSVHDRYKVSGKLLSGGVMAGGTLLSGCHRVEHRYRRTEGIQITIDD